MPIVYRSTQFIHSWLLQPPTCIKIFAVDKKYVNVPLEICIGMLGGRIWMAFSPKGTTILVMGSCHYHLC